jgi:hypothetical protein
VTHEHYDHVEVRRQVRGSGVVAVRE